jgi:DNA-binding response OmpR family regulator
MKQVTFHEFEGEAVSGERWAQLASVDVPVNLVLLVEDDVDSANVSKLILQRHGMSVKIAKDGGQAQASFVMQKPDFVILDLILPGESGFEICERLKHTDDNIPILIFTAIDSDESRALATRVGADGYLTKPADPECLVSTIHRIAQAVWARVRLGEGKESDRIRFTCICGKRFRVSTAHRGRSMTCPQCGEPLTVPS